MLIQENLTIDEKLKILTDAAKYDEFSYQT